MLNNLSVSASKSTNMIYIRDVSDVNSSSTFDYLTGTKINGPLDLSPDTVLYLVWRQKQSPALSESKLQRIWKGMKK